MKNYAEALNELYEDATNGEPLCVKEKHIKAIKKCRNDLQELVKRATPMKPLFAWDYKCPSCNKFITNGSKWQCEKYCDNCGQAIDWKAANEERETERLIAQGRIDAL